MQNQRQMKSRALLNLKTEISKDLIVDYVIDHLIETDVFTEEEKTAILDCGQTLGRVEELTARDEILRLQSEHFIDLLVEKMETNDFAYNNFIFILMKEGYYPWIGNKILTMVMHMKTEAEMVAQLNATPPM